MDSILNLWDHTDYWNTRYGSRETFEKYVAPGATNDEAFFQNELSYYWDSDEYAAWHRAEFGVTSEKFGGHLPPRGGWGDYWALTLDGALVELTVIRDDYGNYYACIGTGPNFPGGALSRGYILIDQGGSSTFPNLVPLADINASDADKAVLARQALEGYNSSASVITAYFWRRWLTGIEKAIQRYSGHLRWDAGGVSSPAGYTFVFREAR